MLFCLSVTATAIAFVFARWICKRQPPSRIYGSLLGALIISVAAGAIWFLHRLIELPHVTLWWLVALTYGSLCFRLPLLFVGTFAIFVLTGRRVKAKSASVVPVISATLMISVSLFFLESGFYAAKVEPNWIQVTHTNIVSPKMRPDAPPLRIVQLSDLHIERYGYREKHAVSLVQRLKPDLILLTGDYTNSIDRAPDVMRFMRGLHAKHGVYAINGNWNQSLYAARLFKGTDVRIIADGTHSVGTASGRVLLVGIPWYSWSESRTLLEGRSTSDSLVILMSHMPEGAEYAPKDVDLVLAGHTHGGQVRIPGVGPVITLSRISRDRAAGLSTMPNGVRLYVNRGLGMEGGGAPRIRFLCRPEISVFTVRGSRE